MEFEPMKLIINGALKPYYVQMLVMLFYPGEKFPETADSADPRAAQVDVNVNEGYVTARVWVKDGELEGTSELSNVLYDDNEEQSVKFCAGAAILEAFKSVTGYTPPWGMLTGVRPAKLASDMLEGGMSREDVISVFTDKYKTTKEKAELAVCCAEVSGKIVTDDKIKECSVYFAIPFCPTRCAYCSFVSAASPKLLAMIPEYLDALLCDVDKTFDLVEQLGIRVATVYIGGGTPTVLNAEQLERLLSRISERMGDVDEFTLEAGRPDTITAEKLSVAKKYGVTRVSVNTQTLSDEVLKTIGRAHSADDFFSAYELAASSGIKDVNVDLIAGLPGDTLDSFKDSIDRVIALDPTNITVHTFSVKRSAEFKTGGYDVFDREGTSVADCVAYSQKSLRDAGYLPYYMYRQKNTVGNLENVGFSKPGHEGLYNIYMMDEIHSIFAGGASSVTKIVYPDGKGGVDIKRICEPKYPYEYLSDKRSGADAVKRAEGEELIKRIYTEKWHEADR